MRPSRRIDADEVPLQAGRPWLALVVVACASRAVPPALTGRAARAWDSLMVDGI